MTGPSEPARDTERIKMAMGLFDRFELFRRWRLKSLSDFAVVFGDMERNRTGDRPDHAMRKCLYRMHAAIRRDVRKYGKYLRSVSRIISGMESGGRRCMESGRGFDLSEAISVIDKLIARGDRLRVELDDVFSLPTQSFVNHWQDILDNSERYISFANKLLREFASPELLMVWLPGAGGACDDAAMQLAFYNMSMLSVRMSRLLEMGRSCRSAWRFGRKIRGFLDPTADVKFLLESMIADYLQLADPIAFAAMHAKVRLSGRHKVCPMPVGYATKPINDFLPGYPIINQEIGNSVQIRPHLSPTPPVLADVQRLDWAIREVFVNALLATHPLMLSSMGLARRGDMKDVPERSPVLIGLTSMKLPGAGGGSLVKIMISDAGIGMTDEQLATIGLWGVSSRRSLLQENFGRLHAKRKMKFNSLLVAGKGVGLAYAKEVFHEHGGELTVQSEFGRGTSVVMTIPAVVQDKPAPSTEMMRIGSK